MKTTTILLLIPTLGVLMMSGYSLLIKDYGLFIASLAIAVFGITVSVLNQKFYK